MKNQIKNLEINNFKSIRHLELDCKRINVFIGEPNVGKSNILEALCLFTASNYDRQIPILSDQIRYEKLNNLFYDQDRNKNISIDSNIGSAVLRYYQNSYELALGPDKEFMEIIYDLSKHSHDKEEFFSGQKHRFSNDITENPAFSKPIKPIYRAIYDVKNIQGRSIDYRSPIKRYIFSSKEKHPSPFSEFLLAPYGENLYSILETNTKLYEECTHFFTKFGLDLLIDTENNKLEVQKRVGSRVYKIPYALAADTLQRIIFHFAAIETNDDSILIFEEPEAHSFPKYISMFADKVIASANNQFFIATHSPYLLTPFIEECDPKDIAIFICTYENYETKARALTDVEIGNIMETGIDLFYNIAAFQK
jgi:AAA15 family ATPase/GTPase